MVHSEQETSKSPSSRKAGIEIIFAEKNLEMGKVAFLTEGGD